MAAPPRRLGAHGAPAKPRGRRAVGSVRAEILRVATRHLAARGFDGMTLQDVAGEVGVSKPSVLHHFPSKQALHAGVIAEVLEHWRQRIPQILLGVGGQERPFDHLVRELIDFFARDPDRARLMLRESLDRPDAFRKLYVEDLQPWLAMFAAQVREGQQREWFRSDVDAERYLRLMLQLIVVSTGADEALRSGDAREDARARNRELLRVARTSLFYDATAPGPRKRGR